MAEYDIVFARSARKEFEQLSDRIMMRALRKIEMLDLEPRPAPSARFFCRPEITLFEIGGDKHK